MGSCTCQLATHDPKPPNFMLTDLNLNFIHLQNQLQSEPPPTIDHNSIRFEVILPRDHSQYSGSSKFQSPPSSQNASSYNNSNLSAKVECEIHRKSQEDCKILDMDQSEKEKQGSGKDTLSEIQRLKLQQKNTKAKSMVDTACTDQTYHQDQSFNRKVESEIIVRRRKAV